jgi:hypothetical protein
VEKDKKMWLRAARSGWLARGLALALALVVCGGAFDWGHPGDDDPDCSGALVHHDHTAHRFRGAPSGTSQPTGHCYICHSLRLLHAALKARDERVVPGRHSTQLRDADSLVARSAPGLASSSRAPPSARL